MDNEENFFNKDFKLPQNFFSNIFKGYVFFPLIFGVLAFILGVILHDVPYIMQLLVMIIFVWNIIKSDNPFFKKEEIGGGHAIYGSSWAFIISSFLLSYNLFYKAENSGVHKTDVNFITATEDIHGLSLIFIATSIAVACLIISTLFEVIKIILNRKK